MEAPIPGKAAIGIEVPNRNKTSVYLRSLIESKEYKAVSSNIPFALGKDIAGKNIIASIDKMPHLLIAGATGSGKSVCINSLIMSILFKGKPDEVKLILVDPKVVELSVYNGLPHLLIPVVTDPRKAANALNWAVSEMTNRYKVFAANSVRDIQTYNEKMLRENGEKMPQIVIIIDELADLMMVASTEVEEYITRIAQLARACGIHLVIATQRPSVDVITGVIKANIPSRIAFAVSSHIDSRTILDTGGAEKLLGKGDMLYHPMGLPKPVRIQGTFISDDEIKRVVESIKEQQIEIKTGKQNEIIEEIEKAQVQDEDADEFLEQAIEMVVQDGQASASYIQRKFKVGYSRAARIIDQLEERGIVGGHEGSKPRKVLITKEELDEMRGN
ncbi:DNA translocase SpoIIIE [bioreactor metagenome]